MKKGPDKKRGAEICPETKSCPPIPSDVLGSYTGTAEDGDRPVQDADDL